MPNVSPLVLFLLLTACTGHEAYDDPPEVVEGPEGPPGPQGPPGPPGVSSHYIVSAYSMTQPGQLLVEAEANCAPSHRVIAGGCGWGEPEPIEGGHDWPLVPVSSAPTIENNAWLCRGMNSGAGLNLKELSAYAVCLELP